MSKPIPLPCRLCGAPAEQVMAGLFRCSARTCDFRAIPTTLRRWNLRNPKPAPIQTRIRAAYSAGVSEYHALLAAVFPAHLFPRAFNRPARGGPPTCARTLAAALRRMDGAVEFVYRNGCTVGRRVRLPHGEPASVCPTCGAAYPAASLCRGCGNCPACCAAKPDPRCALPATSVPNPPSGPNP